MKKAIFLDRDGVINQLLPSNQKFGFICKKEDVVILPNVKEAILTLKNRGYLLFVITNQPAVARGLVSYGEMEALNQFINEKLDNNIERFYFCPHHPEMHPDVPEHAKKYRVVCECRKPAPGMILQAAKEFDIQTNKSWMIGDMITDIATGAAAGCKTILIESPSNSRVIISSQSFNKDIKPDHHAKNLSDALQFII